MKINTIGLTGIPKSKIHANEGKKENLCRKCPFCHGQGIVTYHYHTEAYCGYC